MSRPRIVPANSSPIPSRVPLLPSSHYISLSDPHEPPPQSRWADASPEELFFHTFSFVDQRSLCSVVRVSRSWRTIASDPCLWSVLHLCRRHNALDDATIEMLLKGGRFRALATLCLDNCSAITARTLDVLCLYCPNLVVLSLANCERLNPYMLYQFVQRQLKLTKLELTGVTSDYGLVDNLQRVRPNLRFGFFHDEYAAHQGLRLIAQPGRAPATELATCRYAGANHANRGCWGRIQGRLVFSSQFYHTAGNYPVSVVYTCDAHREDDLSDEHIHRCRQCERLVVREAMWNAIACKLCFDQENLADRRHWINIRHQQAVEEFNFSSIMNCTIRVADRKNIPSSLQRIGRVECLLDYTLPAAGAHAPLLQPTNVPVWIFLQHNSQRLQQSVNNARALLQTARQQGHTRAILIIKDLNELELFADQRVITDGPEGEQFLRLTQQTWRSSLSFLYTIAILVFFTYQFSFLFYSSIQPRYDGRTNYRYYLNDSHNNEVDPVIFLIMGGVLIFLLFCGIFMFVRHRRWFESLFKKFLVADLFAIFAFGSGVCLYTLTQWTGGSMDFITLALVCLNVATTFIMSLYYPLPTAIHQTATAALNAFMAVLLSATLGVWFCFAIALFISLFDILSDVKPQWRLLTPVILPEAHIIPAVPRIIHTVDGLIVRPVELMVYGLLAVLCESIVLTAAIILGVFCVSILVSPYLIGKRPFTRPLPWMFAILVWCWLLEGAVIAPFQIAVSRSTLIA